MKLIDKILEDFSILEDVNASEVDDFQNLIHIVRLKEVMASYGIQDEVINPIIRTLTEEDDDEEEVTFKHDGETRTIKMKTARQYASDIEQGDDSEEKQAAVKAAGLDGDKDSKQDKEDDSGNLEPDDLDPVKTNYMGIGKDDSGVEKEQPKKEKNISKENQKIVNDFDKRINDNIEFLSDDKNQLTKEVSEKIKVLYDENISEEEQKEAAQWLVDNAGFSTNKMPKSGKRKAYLNKIGGDRKILGNGTNSTENLVQKVESLLGELKQFDAKSIKNNFSTNAKPDLGDENILKPKDDPRVAEYFSNHQILKKIRGGLHGIYGVKDEDGKIKMPSSEHSIDYLTQSFKNPALQNTINLAKKEAEAGNIDGGVATSLETHQENLDKILKNHKIPSEKARQAIADSYNDLMVGLHKSDPDIANSIMKQIAENNLYEQELANGEEVYLPSAGNFPAGDKIKGGTAERVALVSCKFGKKGRIYGCPANSKTISELHQDESKRYNQGQYLGEEGYTLVINDKLIKGKTKEETKEKTQDFIKRTLDEPPKVDLSDTFTDEEVNQISTIVSEYMEEIDNIKKELAGIDFPDTETYWKEFSKKVKEIEGDYKKRMGGVVTKEHAAALIGENNTPNLVQKGGVKIEALMSAIEIANNIRTNESLLELEHNKQYYDENRKPKFVTDKGTNNPNDYSITFRTKRTAGRTGGGCQLSYTGDGTPAENNLQDDGSLTDSRTGEEVEV